MRATSQRQLKYWTIILLQKQTFLLKDICLDKLWRKSEKPSDQFVCRLRQRAISYEFGAGEDDYIHDQVIDKCYSNHLRQKFLEKERALTLDDLLRIARSQEAVHRQLKQFSADQMNNQENAQGNNQKNDQVNAVGGKLDGRKAKICFGCGQEGHFSGDKKCLARGRACWKCRTVWKESSWVVKSNPSSTQAVPESVSGNEIVQAEGCVSSATDQRSIRKPVRYQDYVLN